MWPLAYFVSPNRCFGSLGVGEEGLVWREANLRRGSIYCQFLVKVASSPLCASNPPDRLGKDLFLAVSPAGLFSGCVARFWYLTVSSGVVLVVASGPGYPGYEIKGLSRTGTALLSCVTAVQQGFTVRGCNIGTNSGLLFVNEAQKASRV